MKNIVFFVMVVIASLLCPAGYGLLSDVKAATDESNDLDGTWSMTERFCVNVSTGQTCGTNEFDVTISGGAVYVEDEDVGSVTQEGKKVSFEYNTDYLSSKFEELFQEAGYEVTIESLAIKKYEGKLKNNRMSGKIKGTVNAYFTLFQKTIKLNYTGRFKGKK
ncbi:MAG: hypothetical protein HW406_620 [Candidatus Brocadiaceae bacterium]|nr:hypothetical protein [Candidatus Brocadiaceae bacterium]